MTSEAAMISVKHALSAPGLTLDLVGAVILVVCASLYIGRIAWVSLKQMQGEQPQLWALVDPDQPNEWRTFEMYGTGHPMPANPGEYVETFQMDGGALVWHVFEAPRTEE